jgi:class 3 adenylate cyclase
MRRARRERLDFTVVGPAVNEVARIAAMCRSAERNVLLSQALARWISSPMIRMPAPFQALLVKTGAGGQHDTY